jgi:mono/diheme cytochrome c family protein
VSFATHPGGILIRFINLDTRGTHAIHSSGSPIPHQGTTAANHSSTGPQPATLSAATATASGGVYEYMVTTQTKVTDTYYCHLHETGTAAKTLTFNAFAAPISPTGTDNPNAKLSYINTQVLQPKCVRCHGTDGGYSFSSYANTLKALTPGDPTISALYLSVAPGGNMPQGAPALSTTDVQAIRDWISAGAPNN